MRLKDKISYPHLDIARRLHLDEVAGCLERWLIRSGGFEAVEPMTLMDRVNGCELTRKVLARLTHVAFMMWESGIDRPTESELEAMLVRVEGDVTLRELIHEIGLFEPICLTDRYRFVFASFKELMVALHWVVVVLWALEIEALTDEGPEAMFVKRCYQNKELHRQVWLILGLATAMPHHVAKMRWLARQGMRQVPRFVSPQMIWAKLQYLAVAINDAASVAPALVFHDVLRADDWPWADLGHREHTVTALQFSMMLESNFPFKVAEAQAFVARHARTQAHMRKTALMLVANYGTPEVAMLLLEQGAEIEAVDREGMRPLMFAARGG